MEFNIEKATESDLEEIVQVVDDAYAVECSDVRSHKRTPRFGSVGAARNYLETMWIVKDQTDKIIGCARTQLTGDVVKIGPVAVKVGHQGQGIGSKLLEFAESLAPISQIGVVSFRDDLFSFYGKRGYIVTSREPITNLIPIQFLQRTDVDMVYLEKRKQG